MIPQICDEEECDGCCGVTWDGGRQKSKRRQSEKFMAGVRRVVEEYLTSAELFNLKSHRIRWQSMFA